MLHKPIYLVNFILESLRKYPPFTVLFRKANKDYRIPGTDTVIEKNGGIIVPVFSIQRDPQYYDNPDKFDPDRFQPEEVKKRPHCFMQFGEGPRNCIAARFGMMQARTGLVTLLRNFEVDIGPRTIKKVAFSKRGIVNTVEGELFLNIKAIM